jgi:hypothetical protein
MAINRSVDRKGSHQGNALLGTKQVSVAEAQLARVAGEGSARHSYLGSLLEASGPHSGRDLADAVHLLCSLHGRYPGLIEIALQHCSKTEAAHYWLAIAAESFERERHYLVRLTSAVGPMPSTPGAAETEASLLSARHALETLANSERKGCALGAATALIGDWLPIRQMLDRVAARAGIDPLPGTLPDDESVVTAIEVASDTQASERALAFGGEQLLLQHRALFDLLEARAEARGDF